MYIRKRLFVNPPKCHIIPFQLQTKFHTHFNNFRNKFVCALENILLNLKWRRRQNSCHSLSKRASRLANQLCNRAKTWLQTAAITITKWSLTFCEFGKQMGHFTCGSVFQLQALDVQWRPSSSAVWIWNWFPLLKGCQVVFTFNQNDSFSFLSMSKSSVNVWRQRVQ